MIVQTLPNIVFLLLVVGFFRSTSGKEHSVGPDDDLRQAFLSAEPGDGFVLENGVWKNKLIEIEAVGTSDKPVLLKAQSPGKVILTGESGLKISGRHVVVSGLKFQDTHGLSEVVQFRTSSKSHARDCRLTNCVIENSTIPTEGAEAKGVSIYGENNRVDHCSFEGKRSAGALLVVWVGAGNNRHRIDRNYFADRPPLGHNGGETIRIGTSDVSMNVSETIVEDNLFVRCDGESEIISNKSCGNVYRRNTFRECSGALTLRHGDDCRVEQNFFLGNNARGTGGVRIIGSGHVVVNNYFSELQGDDARSGVSFMNGLLDSPLSGYFQVQDAVVAFNTFVDCKVAMTIGLGAGPKQPLAPRNCTVQYNVFAGRRNEIRSHAKPIDWTTGEDIRVKSADEIQFHIDDDGVARPTQKSQVVGAVNERTSIVTDDLDGQLRTLPFDFGCDQFGTSLRGPIRRADVGPDWPQRAEN